MLVGPSFSDAVWEALAGTVDAELERPHESGAAARRAAGRRTDTAEKAQRM